MQNLIAQILTVWRNVLDVGDHLQTVEFPELAKTGQAFLKFQLTLKILKRNGKTWYFVTTQTFQILLTFNFF